MAKLTKDELYAALGKEKVWEVCFTFEPPGPQLREVSEEWYVTSRTPFDPSMRLKVLWEVGAPNFYLNYWEAWGDYCRRLEEYRKDGKI